MPARFVWLVAGLLLCLAACSHPVRSVPAESTLQQAIQFEKVPLNESRRELSTRKGKAVVPAPGALDWNSRLQIDIDRAKLAELAHPSTEVSNAVEALSLRRQQLIKLLNDFKIMMQARTEALLAYQGYHARKRAGQDAAEQLATAKEKFGDLDPKTGAFMEAASEYFLQRELAVIHAALDALDTLGKDSALQAVLQGELDSVAKELSKVRAAAAADGFALRIEAFLDGPDRLPTPIHVDGYDRLPEGKLESRDRLGLALEGAALERFDALSTQSRELATTLEEVRTGASDLSDALASMTGTVLGSPAAVVTEGLAIQDKLKRVPTRLEATKKAAEKLQANAVAALEDKVDAAKQVLDAQIDQLESALDTPGMTRLLVDATELATLLANPRPESFPTIHAILVRLPLSARAVADGLGEQASQSVMAMLGAIEAMTTGPEAALNSEALALWEGSELKAELENWRVLVRDLEGFVKRLKDLSEHVGLNGASPIPADLHNSEAITVPFASIRNTWVDLQRTPRLEGDMLTVRITPLQAGRDLGASLSVPFQIQQYGWHARLDPSVVLARPTSLGTGQERFQFAPMLSWSHTMTPRPEQDGFWNDFFRSTGFSFGPHATFLNTTDQSDLEIGLGVTLGFWDGILLMGGGWNLGADRDADGDYYYVVGSSLVSLLQKFQEGD